MAKLQKKSLSTPDETRTFDKGKSEIVTIGGFKFARITQQPGWKWSTSVKPIVKTNSCQVHHAGYVISGQTEVVMDNGTKIRLGPGDAFEVPPGHDAWVVGNDPFVFLEFIGAEEFAKRK